ncbi:hypothetical protein Tco_0754771 [Tanacetum coccineum]
MKMHRKTAYDVFRGRAPDISYFHVFGCPIHIHNHKDHLGKFNEKADDGFFLDDEVISQTNTEGDAINFNEIRCSRDKHIDFVNIIGEPLTGVTTRSKIRDSDAASAHECLYVNFLSKIKPKKLIEALLEAIRIFLAYAAYMGFMVYQMDVKSAFLNGKLLDLNAVNFQTMYQANPKESHLVVVKRIFWYLKGTPNLGLWYLKGSGFDLKAYSDSDYARCNLDRKSTSCGCQILRRNQLANYDVLYDKVPIFCDNTSVIAISNNPVLHSRTKHIDIRYYFIRDHILKGDIELHFIPTELQLADIFTKPLAEPSFTRMVAELEVDDATKDISFSLSLFENQLSFNHFDFLTAIGLIDSKSAVPLPPKGTVKAGLATLGLADKDKPSLTSTKLPLSQPKALTAKKSKKKIIPSLTQPKVFKNSREMNPPSTTTHIQETKEFVVTAVPIQSLEASVMAEVQLMPDDDIRSFSGFEDAESDDTNDNEVSHFAHTSYGIAFAKRELSKVIKFEVAKKVQVVGLEGVREDLQSQTKHISKYSSSFQDMYTPLRDVKDLLKLAVIIDETTKGEKKQKDINAILALTQGEQKTAENITHPELSPKIQGGLPTKNQLSQSLRQKSMKNLLWFCITLIRTW